ncbi:MAG: flagellar hook-associated protein FlgL [Proteobacteria bacterium]|uniref:flagellar hook-associated protein FlgL n=1 Tax=Aquabacterium sp. TaxID=1872578 RepID=UPI0035C68AC5|nr:flagellar hook-associated protein FlgL [Pseudomonadota bacterium]
MRIASTQYHATMNTALQGAQSRVEDVMQQMASGQKLLRPSDDPVTHVRLLRLSREDAALTQFRDNISALKSRLQQNEALLDGMVSDMQSARDLLVWAADGGNNANDVAAMADSLKALRDSLFYTANSRDQEGRYLFSGTLTGNQTLTFNGAAAAGARYAFNGNTAAQKVVVGNDVTQTANVSLPDAANLLNQLDAMITTLQTPGVDVSNPATHAQIATMIDTVDGTLNTVAADIARLGGAQNTLDTLDTNHANVSLSNRQAQLQLGQLDYGDAAVKLNGYTSALQATQKAYGKVAGLSLFDVI